MVSARTAATELRSKLDRANARWEEFIDASVSHSHAMKPYFSTARQGLISSRRWRTRGCKIQMER